MTLFIDVTGCHRASLQGHQCVGLGTSLAASDGLAATPPCTTDTPLVVDLGMPQEKPEPIAVM